jgi:hypothetical protein
MSDDLVSDAPPSQSSCRSATEGSSRPACEVHADWAVLGEVISDSSLMRSSLLPVLLGEVGWIFGVFARHLPWGEAALRLAREACWTPRRGHVDRRYGRRSRVCLADTPPRSVRTRRRVARDDSPIRPSRFRRPALP